MPISKQEIDNSLETFRVRGFRSPWEAAMYVISKSFLGVSIPNSQRGLETNIQQIINYLNSNQRSDGAWYGYWTDMFTTHRVLFAYYHLNATPALPMDQFFSKYDTWGKAKDYILYETKTDLRDIYHIAWGWSLYYWRYPPWLPEFFTEVESDLSWTITGDFHKTTHILYNYVIARRPFPNLDGIINKTLSLQNPDGSWGDGSRPVYHTSIEISLLTQVLKLYPNYRSDEILVALNRAVPWVTNSYRTQIVDSQVCGYFGDIINIEDALFAGILNVGQLGILPTNVDMTFQDVVNRIQPSHTELAQGTTLGLFMFDALLILYYLAKHIKLEDIKKILGL